MATIVTRAGKGSALTNAELDANFTNLNTELGGKGDVSLNGAQTLTNKTLTGLKGTAISAASGICDLQTGNYFTKTATANWTLSVSATTPPAGTAGAFIIEITNGGAWTTTWLTGTKWAGGAAPTLTTSGRDILGFYTHDGGTTWNGLVLAKDIK